MNPIQSIAAPPQPTNTNDAASAFEASSTTAPRWKWLPAIGTWKYHALIVVTGMLILGPLCGLTSAYMVFSLGFFVGGQVLAGILGSVVTFGYGREGRHGANYIQTIASSVAGMSAMGIMVQALVWLGLPQPPLLPLMLYMLCIGMFGAGVGMLYTPLLVDRLQLPFPSGLAVANILRALTDPVLLRRSIAKLGGGTALGVGGAVAGAAVPVLAALELSVSTIGAGMIVGTRIAVPALVASLIFTALTPYFVAIGWLQAGAPYRKIAFLLAVGGLLGAVSFDLAAMLAQTARRWRKTGRRAGAAPAMPGAMSTPRLLLWTACWGAAVVAVGALLLQLPTAYLLVALALVLVFGLINGIANGISDSNPVSAAFVIAIMLMATLGLRDPMVGLLTGSVLSIAISVAGDMQQDRSTGWRLGSSRLLQFRYQAGGILLGAVAAIGFARLFMSAYPVLAIDQTTQSAAEQAAQWTSAGTYKLVAVLRSLTTDSANQRFAMQMGIGIGFAMQVLRTLLKGWRRYRQFVASGKRGFGVDWLIDTLLFPSPYALVFGGFITLPTAAYFAAGGAISSWMDHSAASRGKSSPTKDEPEAPDMSTASLIGGGLIAGEAIAALVLGISGLLAIALG